VGDSDGDGKEETILTFAAELLDGTTVTPVTGAERLNVSSNTSSLVSITDKSLAEGDVSGAITTTSFNFDITLNPAVSSGSVTVNYSTSDGSASAGEDYLAITNGSVTFNPGETTKTIPVLVNRDDKVEGNETFNVNLSLGSAPNGVTLGKSTGVGTILTDDTASISIGNVSLTEGNSPTKPFTFTVTLNSTGTLSSPVTVNYSTSNGSASAGEDYVAINNNSVIFNPGESGKNITVQVVGDTVKSNPANETFFVDLSFAGTPPAGVSIAQSRGVGTIQNDDTGPARE
jgi:hypothetical protein